MIVCAPASRAPRIAASPTPPQPITATLSPRLTPPVLRAAPRPAITPQPSRPATAGLMAGSTLVHWPAATSVLSANAPMPRAGDSTVPSARVIFWTALYVLKQYHGRPRRQARQCPQTARQLRITKSPGATSVTPGPDRLDHPRRLVAEQVREVRPDAALLVVQVGVAHPARLHGDQRLARPGLRHQNGRELNRLALTAGHHAPDADRHGFPFLFLPCC